MDERQALTSEMMLKALMECRILWFIVLPREFHRKVSSQILMK